MGFVKQLVIRIAELLLSDHTENLLSGVKKAFRKLQAIHTTMLSKEALTLPSMVLCTPI